MAELQFWAAAKLMPALCRGSLVHRQPFLGISLLVTRELTIPSLIFPDSFILFIFIHQYQGRPMSEDIHLREHWTKLLCTRSSTFLLHAQGSCLAVLHRCGVFIQVNGAGLVATCRWLELQWSAGASAVNANTTSHMWPILPGAQV